MAIHSFLPFTYILVDEFTQEVKTSLNSNERFLRCTETSLNLNGQDDVILHWF